MRTLSVKEVASVLGLTKRAIMYRLESGKLKGTRVTNSYGQEEWRVYPNKEIMQAIATKGQGTFNFQEELEKSSETKEHQIDQTARVDTAVQDPQFETLAARVQELEALLRKNSIEDSSSATSTQTNPKIEDDVVEAVVSGDDSPDGEDDDHLNQQRNNNAASDDTRSGANAVADALWNNLICRFQEKLEEKDQLIGEFKKEIEEQKRQLRLLPDLQKQAEQERLKVEAERKAAELNELEAKALRKQVEAMQVKRVEADLAKQKIQELEYSLTESQRAAEEQIQRLKAEKDEEAKALEAENERLKQKAEEAALSLEKLQLIEKEMQLLKRPWWKKFFLPAPEVKQ